MFFKKFNELRVHGSQDDFALNACWWLSWEFSRAVSHGTTCIIMMVWCYNDTHAVRETRSNDTVTTKERRVVRECYNVMMMRSWENTNNILRAVIKIMYPWYTFCLPKITNFESDEWKRIETDNTLFLPICKHIYKCISVFEIEFVLQ